MSAAANKSPRDGEVLGRVNELPEGATPLFFLNQQIIYIDSPLKQWPIEKDIVVYYGSIVPKGKKTRYLRTYLSSVFAQVPGKWELVPDAILPSNKPAKPEPKKEAPEKKDYYEDIEYKALSRRQLDNAPYDARPRDADGDKICQEGTIWERPCGTRIVSFMGEEIPHGKRPNFIHARNRIVDHNGGTVKYTRGSRGQATRLPTLNDLATLTEEPSERKPRRAVKARTQVGVSTPSRLSRFMPAQRSKIAKDFKKLTGMTIEKATKNALDILNNVSLEKIESGRRWYWEAHDLAQEIAKDTEMDFELVVGLVAALSTRMTWDKTKDGKLVRPNLEFARLLASKWQENEVQVVTAEMIEERGLTNIEPGEYPIQSPEFTPKNLAKLLRPEMSEEVGNLLYEKPLTAAIKILRTGDVDSNLGGSKVRSFFDNIYFPDQSDAATVDSIATQLIGLMQAGKHLDKGGGIQGSGYEGPEEWQTNIRDRFGKEIAPVTIYPAYVEIMNRVAEQWNEAHPQGPRLSASAVQAILWIVQRDEEDLGMPILIAHFKASRAYVALERTLSKEKKAIEKGTKRQKPETIKRQKKARRDALAELNKLKRAL